ncbi:MAG: Hsp20 family protein [Bacteroidetes bacterium]|nr:Hsp20 family protein [Fibrella sp.]
MRAIENVFQGAAGQIDLLNTLYGGSSQTLMDVVREDDRMVISLSAPGVSANSFNVLVEGNKLVIYTLLVGTPVRQNDESLGQRLAVPMFLKVLDIPPVVDAEQIEAVHTHGNVTVVLPYKSDEKMHRRVEIQGLR